MNLVQGSKEWLSHRAKHFNASDAAAMLGVSKYKTRNQLLREKATGVVPEVDAATQARFDRGHEIEALARPITEDFLGVELFPVVLSKEIDGLPLSSSLDGLTMLGDITWECKTANKALIDAMSDGIIPGEYWPQMEQGLLLSGASKCLFSISDGTKEGTVSVWYEANQSLRKQLLSGWKQFAEDLANYQHVETKAEAIGATIEALPALIVQVEGRVVSTNMDAFKTAAAEFIDRLPKALETDQDFADAEKAVKACKDAEDKLVLVKQQAQAQAVDIDTVFRAMDQISAQIRDARLALDKQVKTRKDDIRAKMVTDANNELAAYRTRLNERLGGDYMPVINGGFQDSIKGKKSISGLEEGIGTAMAAAKIAANDLANTIEINRKVMLSLCDPILFPDFKQVCVKSTEDFAALVALRVTQKQEAERARVIKETEQRAKTDAVAAGGIPVAAQTEAVSSPPDNGKTMKLGEISARLGFQVTADFLHSIGYPVHATDKNAKLYLERDFPGMCDALVREVIKAKEFHAAT